MIILRELINKEKVFFFFLYLRNMENIIEKEIFGREENDI